MIEYKPKKLTRYFSPEGKFLPDTMAKDLEVGVMMGPDNTYWSYELGVFRRDPLVIQRRVVEILKDKATPTHTNKVLHIIEPRLEKLSHDQPDPSYINLENGMYNIKRKSIEPHSPAFHSIVQLPILYDKDAKCPIFEEFLSKVCPKDAITMVWQVIAYLLIPGNPFQKSILFYGSGSNGKSNFINVMEAMIGRENCSNITLKQMSKTFEPAELLGKQINTVGDLDLKFHEDTEAFKKLVGGDRITAQRKNKDPFTFVNWAVPLFASNTLWASVDQSEGYWRRWQIISFPYKVNEHTFSHTREELFAPEELAGIFNKAMTYLPNLMRQRKFDTNLMNELLMSEFQHESDNVATWLDDDERIAYNQPDDRQQYSKKSYAYQVYRDWCKASNHRELTNQKFYKRLAVNGFTFGNKDNNRVVFGIALKDYNGTTQK
jgi:putative DNA primase/helicase